MKPIVAEMNVSSIEQTQFGPISFGPISFGPDDDNTTCEDPSINKYEEFVFQNSANKNMDKLWLYCYKNQTYPKYYIGIAKKMAICKCPTSGKEEWFNGDRCLSVQNPKKGSTIMVTINSVTRDFIFLGWAKFPVHEWKMTNGTVIQLTQRFIEGLSLENKRYLKINR